MENRKIGMLGTGNMASALIRGLLSSKTLRPDQIRGSDVRAEHFTVARADGRRANRQRAAAGASAQRHQGCGTGLGPGDIRRDR